MSTPSIVQHWPHSAQFNNDAEVAASLWGSAFGAVADRLSIAALSITRKSARAALKSARSWGIGMRGVGLVTLLSVGAVSAAPTARPPQAEAAVPAFVKCVARTAPDANQTYFITISDGGKSREILLQNTDVNALHAEAMEHCK
jgi:hypothetical protein